MKILIPFLLVIVLTACGGGGGGGGGSSPSPNSAQMSLGTVNTDTNYGFVPSIAEGSFTADGAKYVVVAGWYSGSSNTRNPSPEVKVFKVNADTSVTDATTAILGGAVTASVNFPLVADFNGDGIDDIALMGFTDSPALDFNPSYIYLSNPGHAHQLATLPGQTWNHSVVAGDLDADGDIDIINSLGQIWINDGSGNFAFQDHTVTSAPPYWMHGSGVCLGDFNNSGRPQVVITDLMLDGQLGPVIDNSIFELNSNLLPVNGHNLPAPYYDPTGTGNEISHDVSCVTSDLNNDGKLDIVIISASNALAVRQGLAPHEHVMQVYLNQGNFVFADATTSSYQVQTLSSYIPHIVDYNGDGNKDIWLASADNQTLEPNLLWMNNGNAAFTRSNVPTQVRNKFSSIVSNNLGIMYPIKLNNEWLFVTTAQVNDKLKVGVIKP
jgi:hypothetical protein